LSTVDKVIVAGMGGSGIIGDILVDWLQPRISIPIYVVKDYHLPCFVNNRTLVLSVSCSGNTDETISTVIEGIDAGAHVTTVSSGGRLEKLSLTKGVIHTKVKALRTPRSSLPYLFYPAASILRDTGILRGLEDELDRSVKNVEDMKGRISLHVPFRINPAKKLAKWVHTGLPVIYAPQLLRGAAIRFKNSLNEDAKMHALIDFIPELCHNEVETWVRGGEEAYRPVFLRYLCEPFEVKERFRIMRSIIEGAGVKVRNESTTAGDPLGVIISTIYLLDYTAVYVAVLKSVNPLPTLNIDTLKKRLKRTHSASLEKICKNE
jgi:glucose/mannose-6-phosphate isomerase